MQGVKKIIGHFSDLVLILSLFRIKIEFLREFILNSLIFFFFFFTYTCLPSFTLSAEDLVFFKIKIERNKKKSLIEMQRGSDSLTTVRVGPIGSCA